MSYIRDVKNKIRDTYRAKRRDLTPDVKASLDRRIVKHMKSLASYRFAEVILAYHPLATEVDIRPLLEDVLASGKKLALPRCGEGSSMDFYFVTSLDELVPGAFGLLEPSDKLEKYNKNDESPALMIIPALVYDRLGYRLGYGRGYYDRYINGYKGVKAGVCYNACVRSSPLPKGRYDFAVDYIVTEKGVKLSDKV